MLPKMHLGPIIIKALENATFSHRTWISTNAFCSETSTNRVIKMIIECVVKLRSKKCKCCFLRLVLFSFSRELIRFFFKKKSKGFGRTVAGSFGSWKQSSLFIEHSKSFNIAAV
jgi:hypothetical protein